MIPRPPILTLFPYTTLFRSNADRAARQERQDRPKGIRRRGRHLQEADQWRRARRRGQEAGQADGRGARLDRKSTRLNSSHQIISYAVFCLKKKKIKKTRDTT